MSVDRDRTHRAIDAAHIALDEEDANALENAAYELLARARRLKDGEEVSDDE